MLPSMGERQEYGRALVAVACAALATALFVAWLALGIGGELSVLYVDDLGTVLAALVATVLCVRAGHRESGQLRAFWWLLAAAAGAFTLGESIWAVYDLVLREAVPVPSWADLGYLSGIPLAVAALLAHPAVRGGGVHQAREVFDGLLVATSLLFLSWTFVLGPLWKSTDLTTVGGLVAMAYPFGDVVIVFFVVLAVRRMSGKGRLPLWLLLGGLLAMALADSTYAYLMEANRYATGDLVDSGWIVAYLGIAAAAFCSHARGSVTLRDETTSPGLAGLVAPFLCVLLGLGVVSVQVQLGDRPDDAALIMACALVALTLIRQGLLVVQLVAPREGRPGTARERLQAALLGGVPE